jgi:hypothetical protein
MEWMKLTDYKEEREKDGWMDQCKVNEETPCSNTNNNVMG